MPITTRITVKPYIAAYFRAKYWDQELGAVSFGLSSPVRFKIVAALRKRPATCPVDTGNLDFVIPWIDEMGKDPRVYNYIPPCKVEGGAKRPGIARMLEDEMLTDFHDFWMGYRDNGLDQLDAVEDFVDQYDMGCEPMSFMKLYTRWRDRWRKHKKTRKYEVQQSTRGKTRKND